MLVHCPRKPRLPVSQKGSQDTKVREIKSGVLIISYMSYFYPVFRNV